MNFTRNDIYKSFDISAEPANKFTTPGGESFLSSIHNDYVNFYRGGVSSLLILKEPIRNALMALAFKPFNLFYDAINRMMGELANGGFINYWLDSMNNIRGLTLKVDNIGPQVLTMEHLMIGFQICLATATSGMIVFGAEVAVEYFKAGKFRNAFTT